MRDVVKRIDHPNGKRYVEIFRNSSDGTFTFEEFFLDERENAFCPVAGQSRALSRMASVEEALKEARSRIRWLGELKVETI